MTPEDKMVRSFYRLTAVLSFLAGGILGIVIVRFHFLTSFQVWMLNFTIDHLMNGNPLGLISTNFVVNSRIFSKFLFGFILGGGVGAGVVTCIYKWNFIKSIFFKIKVPPSPG